MTDKIAATPGPWTAGHLADDESTCNCRYIFGNDDRMGSVAIVEIDDGKGNGCPPLDEAKANIRLIAAAPDLLAALERLVADYGDVPDVTDTDGQAVFAAARAALAKAR